MNDAGRDAGAGVGVVVGEVGDVVDVGAVVDGAGDVVEQWVYRNERRALPKIHTRVERWSLDGWKRERVHEPLGNARTQRVHEPLGNARTRAPGTQGRRHGDCGPLLPPRSKKPVAAAIGKYRVDQVEPYHGLYRMVKIERGDRSFSVHAVCAGPWCDGTRLRVFNAHQWIVSKQAMQGCIGCSQQTRAARRRSERAARTGAAGGVLS